MTMTYKIIRNTLSCKIQDYTLHCFPDYGILLSRVLTMPSESISRGS